MDLAGVSTPVLAGAVIFTGLVVVFTALVGLWVIVALFGRLMNPQTKKPSAPSAPLAPVGKPAAPAAAPVQQAMEIESGVGDEIVAVIAAAIAAMSGGTEVVRSVRQARGRKTRSNWAQAGVLQNTQQF